MSRTRHRAGRSDLRPFSRFLIGCELLDDNLTGKDSTKWKLDKIGKNQSAITAEEVHAILKGNRRGYLEGIRKNQKARKHLHGAVKEQVPQHERYTKSSSLP